MNMFEDLVSLFFPRCCHTCDIALTKGEHLFCSVCMSQFPRTGYHLDEQNALQKKFYGRVNIRFALAYLKFFKKGKVQRLLHQLKYENTPEIAYEIGKRYGVELYNVGLHENFDLIVPVPLHKSKKRQRGYNQSDGFAKGLSEAMDIPWSDRSMVRLVKSKTQTRKSRIARWKNVEDIFAVTTPAEILDKHVLLVDDVITTGATLESCLWTLKSAGASTLSVATIAEAQ